MVVVYSLSMYARLRALVSAVHTSRAGCASGVPSADPADPSIVCALRPHFGIVPLAIDGTKGRNHAKATGGHIAVLFATTMWVDLVANDCIPRL